MKYDIYFHNDFDGKASAALMFSFLQSRGDTVARYVPVDHGTSQAFFNEGSLKGKNPAIVLDFPYHPGAAWWFDHHPMPFKKPQWQKKFRADTQHCYDPAYFSACHFVYDRLKKDFGWKPPAHFKELVKWLDVIDAARYKSAKQVFALKEPALKVMVYADSSISAAQSEKLIKMLAAKPLAVIAREPSIQRAAANYSKAMADGLAFARKNVLVDGNVAFIDFSRRNIEAIKEGLRFAPFFVAPRARYGMRLSRRDGGLGVSIGRNPWKRPEKSDVHIGELLRRYGGGGHKAAGSSRFAKRAHAEKAIAEMMRALNT